MEEGINHIVDVARGASVENKNSTAITHINFDLNLIGSDHKRLQDLPYQALTSDLAGKIGHAIKYKRPEGKQLSLYSVIGYMSCYKVYCINKYR